MRLGTETSKLPVCKYAPNCNGMNMEHWFSKYSHPGQSPPLNLSKTGGGSPSELSPPAFFTQPESRDDFDEPPQMLDGTPERACEIAEWQTRRAAERASGGEASLGAAAAPASPRSGSFQTTKLNLIVFPASTGPISNHVTDETIEFDCRDGDTNPDKDPGVIDLLIALEIAREDELFPVGSPRTRCMIPACAGTLADDDDRVNCKRCGRLVCHKCALFGVGGKNVTSRARLMSLFLRKVSIVSSLSRICGECLEDICMAIQLRCVFFVYK
jgi:hypothetical protein